MDVFLLILGIILLLAGLVGCVVPFIPGPPLGFLALLALHFTSWVQFSSKLLWIAAILAVVVTLLDYVVPAWGTKKFGGSKAGVWGASLGLLVGLFLGPAGIVLGPFAGALVGELLVKANGSQALRSAFGAVIGLFAGVLLKLVVCGLYIWWFARELYVAF